MGQLMRADWTDDRLDVLSDKVDAGFAQVEREFGRVDKRFEQVDKDIRELRLEMNARLKSMEDRFDWRLESMQRLILQVGGGMIATLAVGLLGVIATQL